MEGPLPVGDVCQRDIVKKRVKDRYCTYISVYTDDRTVETTTIFNDRCSHSRWFGLRQGIRC